MLSTKVSQATCLCLHSKHLPCAAVRIPHSRSCSIQAMQQQRGSTKQAAAAAAARQQRPRLQLPRASKDEEAEIDKMAREASQSDIWGNEVVGTLVKVGIVGAVLAVVLLISNLAKPMYENTIKSFPTPAEYEQYEMREEEEL